MSDVTATGKSFGRKERHRRVRIQWSKPCGFESPFRILLQISVLENWRGGYPPGLGEQRVECGAIQGATVLAPPRGAWLCSECPRAASRRGARSRRACWAQPCRASCRIEEYRRSLVPGHELCLSIWSMTPISIAAHGPRLSRVDPKLAIRLSPLVGAVKYRYHATSFNVERFDQSSVLRGVPRFQRKWRSQ